MNALVFDAVVRDGKIVFGDEDWYRRRSTRAAKRWGDGTALRIRIEPQSEGVSYAQFKYLYGFVFRPVADVSGHTEGELALMAKAQFMPDDGRTSLTELNHEEMDLFTKASEQWLRTEFPDAYVLYDNTRP